MPKDNGENNSVGNKYPNNKDSCLEVDNQFFKSQYELFSNAGGAKIRMALQANNPRVLAVAPIASSEFDLEIKSQSLDFLNNDNVLLVQTARRALIIKLFYLLAKIKAKRGVKTILIRSLRLSIYLRQLLISRWEVWFKRNEQKLINAEELKPVKSLLKNQIFVEKL